MSQEAPSTDRLDSWKEIAAYVGRDVRTVIRWEQKGGLPVYRIPVGQRQAVYAFRHEIDEWMAGATPGSLELAAALEVAGARPDWNHHTSAEAEPALAPAAAEEPSRSRRMISVRLAIGCATAALVLAGLYAGIRAMSPRQIVFTSVNQITNDGTGKDGVLTDGHNLFFNEERNGRFVLATVPADGGTVRLITTPFVKSGLQSISLDGKKLLLEAWEGQEWERQLWILPSGGGEPERVGRVLCHSATWSPDGREIAFSYGNAIYLTDTQGRLPKQLESFTYTPEALQWSPDGRRLRFMLRDMATWASTFWELSFASPGSPVVSALVPMNIAFAGCCNSATAIGMSERSFATGGELDGRWINVLTRSGGLRNARFTTTQLTTPITYPGSIALDEKSHRLFVVGESASSSNPTPPPANHWTEAYLYDVKSGGVRPFLPGIWAADVNFSRDGHWITWIRNDAEQSLWISRPDGTSAKRIDSPPGSDLELPRWSPDRRMIAFMAKLPGKTWRVFVTSVENGAPREASLGTDSQGAPTWSPDGKWLSYGNVWCEHSHTCAIHEIELSTGREITVSALEGFTTARWSPDGRTIAALQSDQHSIEIFDVKTQQWRELTEGVTGNDLEWSADSRYLYASNPSGNRRNVIRVSLANGSVEAAADLTSFRNMAGLIDTWFALAPDNSIIFLRWLEPNEIYALSYVEK